MAQAETEADLAEADLSICSEMLAAARQHKANFRAQKATEADNDYVEHLLEAIADVPDEIWNALSVETQDWFKQAADAINAGGTTEPPPGFVSAFRPKPTKAAKPKKLITREKPVKPVKEAVPTMGKLIRQAIIDNRHITVPELEGMLAANGFTDIKRSTVFSFQRGSLDTLKVAEEMGRFQWPDQPAA